MSSRLECEFLLVQYVPDPVRNEFVHVGVILRTVSGDGRGGRVASVKFTSDWRRVRCLDPEADTELLEGLEGELRRRFEQEPDGNLMHVLEDSFSTSVQVTRAKGYLAESVEAGVEELMRMYVEPPKRERPAGRMAGRAGIQLKMRAEFERAGVWDLMRKRIAASEYTRAGDSLRIDCGYRNGVVKMFQAVSLEAAGAGSGVETAKGLAFSAAGLMAGVERVEKARLELTAVVEPLRQGTATPVSKDRSPGTPAGNRDQGAESAGSEPDLERVESYRFAVETMEEHQIRVMTTADLGRVAEMARRELRI